MVNSGMVEIQSMYSDQKKIEKNETPPKIAIIGVGGWGKNHARVLSEKKVLVAICDMDMDKANTLAEKYNVKSYSSIDELLVNESLDACLVCTPTKTHFSVCKILMESKVNVFVEKPLSYSSKECEEMIELAKKNNVILTCGYIERFNPAVQNLKKILEEKKYGELIMMEFHRENRMPLHIKDVGIIYDTTVHDIDTAVYLFDGKPQVVFARAGKMFHTFEDFSTIILGFENNRSAIISSNWITPKKVRKFSAVCTDGIIDGDFISQQIMIEDSDSTTIPRRIKPSEPLSLELEHFIKVIKGKVQSPMVSPIEAANVTKIAEAALLSSSTGSPIYLNLK
ncbi:MAG: Gfo/Idh/MocA family protein [Nitrososphaeraceae archaeon]